MDENVFLFLKEVIKDVALYVVPIAALGLSIISLFRSSKITKMENKLKEWDKAADIIPLNCGKGNAVNAVLNYYGLSKDEAIAFGDGRNDIEMLEAVGTGVAMGNAIDEVKARADVICKSVEEDGVYHYCLEQKLIKC